MPELSSAYSASDADFAAHWDAQERSRATVLSMRTRTREINAVQRMIDDTLWELSVDQLCALAEDSAMPANVRDAAHRELDAKFDRGIRA